ncbi:acyltransferase family protein [Actinomadura livida]|uniref:Acyltransferase family protein n=1 Tax=Actinomadura livida TaxID=79909 RepID=A0A7W7I982_9ACTN|nr:MULTISPECIES: acyltransferase family protein [Actinomadura]MBB4772847.1 fucose 4-O-acetylase-like acetyltransferase [Actinomadura catellatispora]GGU13161.1 membrane protein [Actinomadura livida]
MGYDVKLVKSAEVAESKKDRDPFFDNARFLAVVLVVVGHTVTLFPPNDATHPAVLLLQTFRMPLLIIITGHLARNFVFDDSKVRGLVTGLALPYLIFELFYATYAWATGAAAFNLQILLPTYLMWFLMSVIIWRLTVPFWRNVRWPLAIAVALTLISYTHEMPHELTLRRLLALLPFFVLGVCLQRKHIKFLKKPGMSAVGVLVLAAGVTFYYTGGRYVPEYWTYWDRGYQWLGVRAFPGVFIHLGVLTLATLLAGAVLSLVPSRRTWFTPFGTKTLYAYLLHGLGVMTVVYFGLHRTAFVQTVPGVLISAIAAAAVATLLCTPPVVRATRCLIEPRAEWLFRRRTPPPPAPSNHGGSRTPTTCSMSAGASARTRAMAGRSSRHGGSSS